MSVDIVIEDSRWETADIVSIAEAATDATLDHLGMPAADWEIAVLACDDARIAVLNTEFRGKPSPTNVLSWPSTDRRSDRPGGAPDLPKPGEDPELGDIALAFDTTAREAEAGGLTLSAHATHLIVHAALHLLGYDHENDSDAAVMERMEVEILASMGVADPY